MLKILHSVYCVYYSICPFKIHVPFKIGPPHIDRASSLTTLGGQCVYCANSSSCTSSLMETTHTHVYLQCSV